jgi:hypothetical protein
MNKSKPVIWLLKSRQRLIDKILSCDDDHKFNSCEFRILLKYLVKVPTQTAARTALELHLS